VVAALLVIGRQHPLDALKIVAGGPWSSPGMGHDLMLDARGKEPLVAMLGWLDGLDRVRTAG
jgi:hypothetical protein